MSHKRISARRTDAHRNEPAELVAFHSDVYSSRQIDPRGIWKINVVFRDERFATPTAVQVSLTDEQRRELIEALGGTVPRWTQDDEDAHIARKSRRDYHLALSPEDV